MMPASTPEAASHGLRGGRRRIGARVAERPDSLGRTAGRVFASAAEFLQRSSADVRAVWCSMSGCPVLAGSISRPSWLSADIQIPIIFITGHGDIPMTVRP